MSSDFEQAKSRVCQSEGAYVTMRPLVSSWEQRKLGELTSIKTGDSDLQDAVPDGRYPFFVRSDKVERSNRYLYDGEAILVPGEGRLGEIFHYINGKFDYHQRVYKISDFNGVAAKFVMYSMMRDFKKHALQNTAKATVDSIRLPTLTEFQFSLPKPEEQKKIGQYFSQIDSLITLHQRKCQYRGLYGYLSWEQRKLGDITSSYSGGTPQANNPDYYNGSIPFIRSAEINADKTELYLTEKGLAESSAALVDAGCILYALYGATSGEAGISRINGAINQAILAIYPYAGFDSGFLASWLRREKDAIVATYLQGGQGNLSGAIVKDFKVPVPGLPEQKAIGDCLSSLDNLITLHQREPPHTMKEGKNANRHQWRITFLRLLLAMD